MFNLKSIALKLFRAAKTQVFTSISIITVSICLIMTMGVYIWNAKAQMESEIYQLFGNADMTVGYNPDQQKWLTSEQLHSIAAIEGVAEVSPVLLTATNVENDLPSVYTIGVDNDNLVKSRYHFERNIGENEVIVSQKIASLFNKSIGDTIEIDSMPYVIKEILTPLPGTTDVKIVILSNTTVRQWIQNDDAAGLFTLIKLTKNATSSTVAKNITELDDTLRIDITNEYDFVKANFQSLAIFMIVLSAFILIITTVLLTSTFQLVFFKLREQLMVLRALGATKNQVGKIVQMQLQTIISSGVILGTLCSLVIIKQWLPLLIEKMQLPEAKTDFPLWLAIIICAITYAILQGIMQWQVRKSMSLLPLQIASDNNESLPRMTKTKLYGAGLMLSIAGICLFSAIFEQNGSQQALQTVIGSLIICIVILYLMPYLFSLLLNAVLQPIRMLFGKEAYLACQQLMPQVRKNMPIVLSIIGLMVILIFGTSLFKTVQENEKAYIQFLYETPVVIHNDLQDPTLTNDIIQDIEALPSVNHAYARSNYPIVDFFLNERWQGENFAAIDMDKFLEIGKIQELHGEIDNGVIISSQFAEDNGLWIGDWLQTGIFNYELQKTEGVEPVQVIDIADHISNIDIYFDWSSPIAINSNVTVNEIMVDTTDSKQTMMELQFLHERWPALTFSDYETFTEENNQMFYQRWSLFVGVLVILITATCIGVIQTLLHTIYGKRIDYAIQRLVGLTPNGLIKLILTQVLSFVLFSLTVGTIVGYLFTQLLASIDTNAVVVFDHSTVLAVISVFFLLTCLIFTVQGYFISRKTLTAELSE
ncbi:ABC transporter permease [Sporosarcina sp. ACRSL]|uniref:ABC transporter permease n=1 Tax=Sporosarcina sp. ACRSL TaxID=2918215 RepID=UPI001EF58CD3|nr:ABC transporter permease [Sporosarcina sp. ACRSL]MCG7343837.1 ABC transporter permease [Sporosarcina sp. ACRSL]